MSRGVIAPGGRIALDLACIDNPVSTVVGSGGQVPHGMHEARLASMLKAGAHSTSMGK